MLIKRWSNSDGRRIRQARGGRRPAVSFLRIQGQAQSSGQALALNLAMAPPLPGFTPAATTTTTAPAASPGPLSYRTVTTGPVFRPVAAPDQQYAPGPPQLLSRHLTTNPLHGLSAWAAAQARRLDLAFAAAMDRRPALPWLHAAAAAATAALTALGLHPLSLLPYDLPVAAADWLETRVGEWVLPLASGVALAVGLAAAAWQLRNWVAAHLALFRFDELVAGASRDAIAAAARGLPASPHSSAQPAAAAAAATAAAAGPFAGLVPLQLRDKFATDWKATDRTWLLLIMAARLGALLTAASSLLCAATGSGAATAATVYGVLCFAASLLPLALPHVRQLLAVTAAAAPPAVLGGAASLAAALVLSDAAFLLALAPVAPAALRAAAAAAQAAAAAAMAAAAAASTRLAASQAERGDVATFHVIVRLPMSGTLIDATVGHRPLTAVVGGADGGSTAAAATTVSERDPQERFRPLQALLASSELDGMYIGERRTVVVAAGDAAAAGGGDASLPFRNPGLVWWQPLDDLSRKLGSGERALSAGDVFWYPVGSLVAELGARRLSTAAVAAPSGGSEVAALPGADSWGPVGVVAVAEGWVQLDGNEGLRSGQAEVEVQLVSLRKSREA